MRRLLEFWPNRGTVWDGLGIEVGGNQTRVLLEAKAYIEKADTTPTQAGESSMKRIDDSLDETRLFMKATGGNADWSRSFYQYANRRDMQDMLRSIRRECHRNRPSTSTVGAGGDGPARRLDASSTTL